jgi:hypothetical protein
MLTVFLAIEALKQNSTTLLFKRLKRQLQNAFLPIRFLTVSVFIAGLMILLGLGMPKIY